jgi:hypothetical protein
MFGLVVSGATAIPLQSELQLLLRIGKSLFGADVARHVSVFTWIDRVYRALVETDAKYPFIAYGFDWLAFGHFCLALVYVGPWRDPVRNKWVLQFGMIACALVLPYAIIFGALRGIPFYWRLIDCSFGVLAFPLVWYAEACARKLELRTS